MTLIAFKKSYLWFLFLFALCFSTINGAQADWAEIDEQGKPVFNAQTTTLDNGMQIVVVQNNRAPVVHHMLWYKVGAADEEWGKGGIAHFFEHLMFRGTKNMADGEYSKTVASLGGRDNAFTGQDYTSYFATISVDYLDKIMAMEADRMVNLDLNDEVIETERKVIMEERRQRLENDPFGRFNEKYNQILYPNHPYGMPIIGWMHEIEGYSPDDIRAFYKTHYGPNNAILVIVGDIAFEKAVEMAKTHYGAIPKNPNIKEREWPALPANLVDDLKQKLVLNDPQIRQTYWRKNYLVPSETMDMKRSMALNLIDEMLSGGQAAPFYDQLVQEKKLSISASMSYSGMHKSWGTLGFYATLNDPSEIDAFKAGLDELISNYATNGFSDEEIEIAKERMIASSIFARDSLRTPAYIFGQSLTIGLDMNDVEFWRDRIQTIDKDYIDQTFRDFIANPTPPSPAIEAVLMPEGVRLNTSDDQTDKEEESIQ